ncbi:MAG: hypothetical protein NC238_02060 [Dehalobacter sp.]|nr:hypothetical protein [Dehalobacter sp.]
MGTSIIHSLEGITLNGGWKVIKKIEKNDNDTGGHFSVCYLVENDKNDKAFMKVLNFDEAQEAPDPALQLFLLTQAFNFEKLVLQKCKDANLDKVVVAIGEDVIRPNPSDPSDVAQYILFELADGNIRKKIDYSNSVDLAYNLRALHHVSVGIQQIHGQGIAHQDIKPSNILTFNDNTNKLADFGRSSYLNHIAPHEDCTFAGDRNYAPIEQLYGYQSAEWKVRRLGTDLYHLGSLIHYVFTGLMLTPLIFDKLPPELHYTRQYGNYSFVLPFIKKAMTEIVSDFSDHLIPQLKKDLPQMVLELSNPEPEKRGVRRGVGSPDQFTLDHYISRFDHYARFAEANIISLLRS